MFPAQIDAVLDAELDVEDAPVRDVDDLGVVEAPADVEELSADDIDEDADKIRLLLETREVDLEGIEDDLDRADELMVPLAAEVRVDED